MSNFSSSNVKSFVVRSGRVTSSQKKALRDYSDFFCIPFSEKEVSLKEVFENNNPIVLDIGFGMGNEIIDFSIKNPEKNVLGIEIYKPAIGNVLNNIQKNNIKNIKIINYDAYLVLTKMLTDESLCEIHLYFPDPWPKKKHYKRRLVNAEFGRILYSKLEIGGKIKCATDNKSYADQIVEVLSEQKCFQNMNAGYGSRPTDRVISKFEQKAFDNASKIYEISFVKLN